MFPSLLLPYPSVLNCFFPIPYAEESDVRLAIFNHCILETGAILWIQEFFEIVRPRLQNS